MGQTGNSENGGWTTIDFTSTPLGLLAQERFERFRLEALSELVLRLSGGLMVAVSTVLWLILPNAPGSEQMISHGILAGFFSATGLFVYTYGSRGFRRQLALDARCRVLTLTKVNMNDRGRILRRIRLNEIESLFLRRPAERSQHAALFVRTRRNAMPLLALTGTREELERIHSELCRTIRFYTRSARPVAAGADLVRSVAFAPRRDSARIGDPHARQT